MGKLFHAGYYSKAFSQENGDYFPPPGLYHQEWGVEACKDPKPWTRRGQVCVSGEARACVAGSLIGLCAPRESLEVCI